LSDPAYSSVAVLSVPSLVGLFAEEASFQDTASNFIAAAVAAGKTKLVIDVSANGGGTILQAYNLFKNLFPCLEPYGATRFRAHKAFNIIGETVSAAAGPNYPWDNATAIALGVENYTVLDDFYATPFDYRADMDIHGHSFTSWAQKYGPHKHNGDRFTSIIRWNLSDPTDIYSSGIIVDGYQNRTNIPPSQPFAPESIVIVYDGYCASACTIFSEFMTAQAGIKTVAVGGRPHHRIMQAVGGVKGTNDYTWDGIYALVNDTFTLGTPAQQAEWAGTELGQYSTLPLERGLAGYAVNARDGIREGDASQTPLQFIYQPADCRIFYTAEMTVDVTALWEKVVDVTWGGDSCVAGAVGLGKRELERKREESESRKTTFLNKRDVDVEALAAGMDMWTDLRGETAVGDAYMMP
jgi:Peptidase family S41